MAPHLHGQHAYRHKRQHHYTLIAYNKAFGLHKNDLYIKLEKCEFLKRRIEFLGYIIEDGQVSMDSIKVKGITNWPSPETL